MLPGFKELEKRHEKRRKIVSTFIAIQLACIVIGGIGFTVLMITCLVYPEMIGEFIGRIVKGFNQVK